MSRYLWAEEVDIARLVFKDTIPYWIVKVSAGTGFGNRPYTTKAWSEYTLHLGSDFYKNRIDQLDPWLQATFIHELTHVWQGSHSRFSRGFMISSLLSQGKAWLLHRDTEFAYHYTPGKQWGDYNVEQQAHIVQDWFYLDHRSQQSSLFPYIRDHIWTGQK
jgi:hypothetical protein